MIFFGTANSYIAKSDEVPPDIKAGRGKIQSHMKKLELFLQLWGVPLFCTNDLFGLNFWLGYLSPNGFTIEIWIQIWGRGPSVWLPPYYTNDKQIISGSFFLIFIYLFINLKSLMSQPAQNWLSNIEWLQLFKYRTWAAEERFEVWQCDVMRDFFLL